MTENKVEKVADFLTERFPKGIQMFDCPGIDPTETIYHDDDVSIEWSWYYEFIEVFGLTDSEYKELRSILHKKGWTD